jgi:PAS domain S-box-containing protein
MFPPTPRVLVIEDDADTRANLRDILELEEFQVDLVGTGAEGLARAAEIGADLLAIILDRQLPDGIAVDLLPRFREVAPDAPIIIVTGFADLEGAIAALRQGAADYILKPLEPVGLRASLGRITERHRLAVEKRRSEMAFRLLLEAAECLILIMRPDLSIAYFSPFAERLTGFTEGEAMGRNALELLRIIRPPGVTEQAVMTLLAGRPVRNLEDQITCRDGTRRSMVWTARRLDDYEGAPAFLAVGQDITGLKLAQERALQAERLAAIGQMVTGLAHESRNALQRSQACIEMLALEVSDRPAALDLIRRLQAAQDHLTHLYEDVRGYAAPLRLDRRDVALNTIWQAAWSHLHQHPRHAEAELVESIACPPGPCHVDVFRLEQVFRNIFENALAAGTAPVRIDIACQPSRIDGQEAVEVSIRDHGGGLDPEARQRLFEPFFTTKTRGTGLGMAIVRRIVEAHGGRVAVGDPDGLPGVEILLTLPRGTPP